MLEQIKKYTYCIFMLTLCSTVHAGNVDCKIRNISIEEKALFQKVKASIKELIATDEVEECSYQNNEGVLQQTIQMTYKKDASQLINGRYIYFSTVIDTGSNAVSYSFSEGQAYSVDGHALVLDKSVTSISRVCSMQACGISIARDGKKIKS